MSGFWVGWIIIIALFMLNEGAAAASGHGTFTAFWRTIRGTVIGRLVLWPLWAWLTWHLMIDNKGFDWVDLLCLAVGLVIAWRSLVTKPPTSPS